LVISDFNNNIENIKSIKENISLLKEQLKDDKRRNENNSKKGNKKKSNHTKNIIKPFSTIGQNNNHKSKNKYHINRRNRDNINDNKYTITNFHNYNKNIKKSKERKNLNKTKNSFINNTSIISSDSTPNKNIISGRLNSQNNSNNKTALSLSTNMTNNNVNNGFGKKLNLSSIYNGSQNDKEDKEINYLKENSDFVNNFTSDRSYNTNNENTMKKENINEELNNEIEIFNNINHNNKNKEINNNNKTNKSNEDNKTNKGNITENSEHNYIYKTPNPFTLQNQSRSFINTHINKKGKDTKDIQYQNKNKKNNKEVFNTKRNNQSNLYPRNTVNYLNKKNNNNSLNLRYNTINNDHFNNFSTDDNLKKNIKSNTKYNISYEHKQKKKKNVSKIKMGNSKDIENRTQSTDTHVKKRNSCKPDINKENYTSVNDYNDIMHTPKNKVKKYLTRIDFKYKPISIYDVGIICKAGEAVFGEEKINQDNYFDYSLNDDLRFIGVCDGHGDYGHYVSKFLKKYLPVELEKELEILYEDKEFKNNLLQKEMSTNCHSKTNNNIHKENVEDSDNFNANLNNNDVLEKMRKVFENSFTKTDNNLSEFCEYLANLNTSENIYDVQFSGSTCVSILLKEKNMNKIYIGNVGDSRAIVIKETKSKYWSCWTFHQLSRDHKPSEPDEAQRILDCNGEIEKIQDDDGNWSGPLRVWVKETDGPGLAMTRSFGDEVGTTVGVISTPEVGEYTIKEEDKAIIIASDGLWEYMSNKEVTEIVQKLIIKKDANNIVNQLYKESVKKWKINDQGIDDITIICILLKNN
jgi:serine/threonine protein phosphatase PrpC